MGLQLNAQTAYVYELKASASSARFRSYSAERVATEIPNTLRGITGNTVTVLSQANNPRAEVRDRTLSDPRAEVTIVLRSSATRDIAGIDRAVATAMQRGGWTGINPEAIATALGRASPGTSVYIPVSGELVAFERTIRAATDNDTRATPTPQPSLLDRALGTTTVASSQPDRVGESDSPKLGDIPIPGAGGSTVTVFTIVAITAGVGLMIGVVGYTVRAFK